MNKRFLLTWLLMAILCLPVLAQMQDPVQFKTEWKAISDNEAEIVFTGTIERGWHVYSTDLEEGGPTSATFNIDQIKGAELVGKLTPKGNELDMMDPVFGMQVRFFEGTAVFVQKIKLTGGDYNITGYLNYGACDDQNCMPPTNVEFTFKGKAAGSAKQAAAPASQETTEATQATETENANDTVQAAATTAPAQLDGTTDYWKPVVNELSNFGEQAGEESHSWIYIFFTGLLGGLLALFTPCVWPIIPMTVSFFLKRTKDKKKGIRDAWTYGASIVVIYVTLGLAITLIFGASALNALSTNAIFNILFCLMLIVLQPLSSVHSKLLYLLNGVMQ